MILDNVKSLLRPETAVRDSSGSLPVLTGLIMAGFLVIVVFACTSPDNSVGIASVGSLVAAASLVSGGIIGFLFGIPRTRDFDHAENAKKVDNSHDSKEMGADFRPNTNLEQISDWLTKILVGVGLTQISKISDGLDNAATIIKSGLGNPPQNHVLALAIITYFPICGFLVGYLWTRLYLPAALTNAELEMIRNRERKEAQEKAIYTFSQTMGNFAVRSSEKKTGLWVDDNPSNNAVIKQSFENLLGIEFDLSLSTEDALRKIKSGKYDVILSDMGRYPDRQAGYTLLGKLKELNIDTPYIVYAAGAGSPENKAKAKSLGAFESTNSPQDLLQFVKDALAV